MLTVGGATTCARSVAKLTVAVTPSNRFSFFSTRAAHEAQVMPPIERSTVRSSGRVGTSGQLVVAGLVERCRDGVVGERCLARHAHLRDAARVEVDLDTKRVTVSGDDVDDAAVRAAIDDAGYDIA